MNTKRVIEASDCLIMLGSDCLIMLGQALGMHPADLYIVCTVTAARLDAVSTLSVERTRELVSTIVERVKTEYPHAFQAEGMPEA